MVSVLAIAFLVLDRWMVRYRGLPGTAKVEAVELVQTLPKRVWEVLLEVTPTDRSTASFRRRARWNESDYWPQVQELAPGVQVEVRFRRAPRPLVLPAKHTNAVL